MKDSPNHHHGRGGNGLEEIVGAGDMANPTPFDAMEGEATMGVDDREIWLERSHEDLLDNVNGSSIFYSEFSPLPDFPCMSSSSSSPSTPAPAKPISSSSSSSSAASSAASWAVLKSDEEEDVERKYHQPNRLDCRHDQVDAPPAALSSTSSIEALPPPDEGMGDVGCMDVIENLGYMDLIDSNDIWDPSSIFQSDLNPSDFDQDKKPAVTQQEHPQPFDHQNQNDHQYIIQSTNIDIREQRPLDELGVMFFEWLKTNKEYISAEDMRKIKLRSATVESASKRLGSTKEGRKQLLKLILEWVERYQLQKKQILKEEIASQFPTHHYQDFPFQNPNPNLSCNSIPFNTNTNIFSHTTWLPPQPPPPQPPYMADPPPIMVAPPAGFPQMAAGFLGDPYSSGGNSIPPHQNQNIINGQPSYPPSTEYQILDSSPNWGPSQYAMGRQFGLFPDNLNNNIPIPASMPPPHPQPFPGYGCQYPYPFYQGSGEKLMKLGSSATKEARKKRMARQRRFLSHHRHHNLHNDQNQHQHNQNGDQQARLGSENCTVSGPSNPANWVYWPNAVAPASSTLPLMPTDSPRTHLASQSTNNQRQSSTDKRQGWKTEKNLKFLLQKVLKQSDVGNLGRIVLPKKEAEAHLPELEARDGIPISLEDIGMSRVWNMRYRFWPNNKSRMYLLENTGDFVRANGLQEGDFIVIYSDIKCGKYLIRGVKVRPPGLKSETKKPVKSQRTLSAASPAAGNGLCSPQPSRRH